MDNQFDIGLGRKWKECRVCKTGKLVCSVHSNFENICSTYLLDYKNYWTNKCWTHRQRIETAVLCPVSEDCKEVRETITIEIFFLVELGTVHQTQIFDTF